MTIGGVPPLINGYPWFIFIRGRQTRYDRTKMPSPHIPHGQTLVKFHSFSHINLQYGNSNMWEKLW